MRKIGEEIKFGQPERPEDKPINEYEEAEQEIVDLANELIQERHPHLRQSRILYIMYDNEINYRGKEVPGRVYKVHDREKVKIKNDLEIVISRPYWEQAEEQGKEKAAMDWLLCFCTIGSEAGTWTTQEPDFYGFYSNVDRFGMWDRSLITLEQKLRRQKLPFEPEEEESFAY